MTSDGLSRLWKLRAGGGSPQIRAKPGSIHVHLLVEYDPHHSISQVAKAFKGRTSRQNRQEFPELLKLPSLWTHSYMFDTTGKVSTQKVLEYINDPHHCS